MKYILITVIYLAVGCSSSKQNQDNGGINVFSNSEIQSIYEFQDKRQGDSLLRFFSSEDSTVREKAALAFASIQDLKYADDLMELADVDASNSVKNAAIFSLGQLTDSSIGKDLWKLVARHFTVVDLRIGAEAIGKCAGTGNLPYFEELHASDARDEDFLAWSTFRASLTGLLTPTMIEKTWSYTQSESESARLAAAFTLQRASRKGLIDFEDDRDEIVALFESESNKDVALKYQQMLKLPENNSIEFNSSFVSKFDSIQNPYHKARMLSEKLVTNSDEHWFDFLEKLIWQEKEQCLITAASTVYFDYFFSQKEYNLSKYSEVMKKMLESSDMALQSGAALSVKKIQPANLGLYADSISTLLSSLKERLSLPEKMETYLDVLSALAHLKGEKYEKPKPEYNHPIDWDFVKQIPHDQKIKIKTSKGDITVICFVNEAPGSVSNFLKLVDSGYYDGKFFHRVVGDFVIQSGCNRGDGWGSPLWSQRSEFSNYQTYSTGTMGLASAGKDTEGFQWFITHCPTPFLDGRYSIFGRVLKGMDVVSKIEVGDKVLEIKRI